MFRAARAASPARARALGRGAVVPADIEEPARGYLLAASARLARLGVDARGSGAPVRELGPLEKKRWIVSLVGRRAASFVTDESEARLAARLARFARAHGDLRAFTARDLGSSGAEIVAPSEAQGQPRRDVRPLDEASLARALASPRPESVHRAACAELEARLVGAEGFARVAGAVAPSLVVAYASALLRRGDVGPAYAALASPEVSACVQDACDSGAARDATTAEACVLGAEIARRRGDVATAEVLARAAKAGPVLEVTERARGVLGRLAWDAGDLARAALEIADARAFEPFAAEIRGLVAYSQMSRAALGPDALSRVRAELGGALDECGDGAHAARLEAVRGMIEHGAGRAEESLAAFSRALAHASREGAIAEEASYATGAAAAATDAGDVPAALEEATRAALLWERLGQRARAARAWLSRAASYALLGAEGGAEEAAREARVLAESVGDRVAAAPRRGSPWSAPLAARSSGRACRK